MSLRGTARFGDAAFTGSPAPAGKLKLAPPFLLSTRPRFHSGRTNRGAPHFARQFGDGAGYSFTPRLLGSECQDRCEQTTERVENFMHRKLGGAASRRIGRVAIHSVFGDVDVEAAEIDCAEVIHSVVNLVELEGCIGVPAFRDDMIEPIENPAID